MSKVLIRYLSINDIAIIISKAKDLFAVFEIPVPKFELKFKEKLLSSLALPRQAFFDFEPYPGVFDKAACYFFMIIKNHPFSDGNKRMAVVSTYVFLGVNNIQLKLSSLDMYKLAKQTAKGKNSPAKSIPKIAKLFRMNSKK